MRKNILVLMLVFLIGCATLPSGGIPCPDNTKEVEKAAEEIKKIKEKGVWGKIFSILLLPKYFLYTIKDTVSKIEYYIIGKEPPPETKNEKIVEQTEVPTKAIIVCAEMQKDPSLNLFNNTP